MSLYSYLLSIEKDQSCFSDEVTRWERLCIWVLRNVYAGRYWKDVAIQQSKWRNEAHKIREVVN